MKQDDKHSEKLIKASSVKVFFSTGDTAARTACTVGSETQIARTQGWEVQELASGGATKFS